MIFERTPIFEFDPAHPHCHASVILELPNGELMAVWYAGKAEAHKTVGIKASWKPISGGTWSTPILIHKTPGIPDGNMIIVWYHDQLHMYFNTIHFPMFPWSNTKLRHMISNDFGRTWSEPELILNDPGFTVRNKALLIGDRMLIPVGRERIIKEWSYCLITENGKDYHLSQPIYLPKGNNIQPTIVQLGNGYILAYLRTDQDGIYSTVSTDKGETWSPPQKVDLVAPNAALDMVRTKKGELILIFNNLPKKGGWAESRRAIHVGYSADEGAHWRIIKEIERNTANGQLCYPAIIQGSDGLFHATYTRNRKNIGYLKFDLDWLIRGSNNE
jgi:predicted neuraminidase